VEVNTASRAEGHIVTCHTQMPFVIAYPRRWLHSHKSMARNWAGWSVAPQPPDQQKTCKGGKALPSHAVIDFGRLFDQRTMSSAPRSHTGILREENFVLRQNFGYSEQQSHNADILPRTGSPPSGSSIKNVLLLSILILEEVMR
jgi:hypothetical protein